MFADACSIEDYCSSSDQTLVSYPASVNDRTMRNRHSSPNNRGVLSRAMHYGVVLDARIRAYPDVAIVASEDCARPYACSGSDDDIANYRAARRENRGRMNSWLLRA